MAMTIEDPSEDSKIKETEENIEVVKVASEEETETETEVKVKVRKDPIEEITTENKVREATEEDTEEIASKVIEEALEEEVEKEATTETLAIDRIKEGTTAGVENTIIEARGMKRNVM